MFGTSGIRGPVGETITAELALHAGRALATTADRVVIGRDPRETGTYLADALAAGLRESGTDVVRLGPAATPTVARAVAWQAADAGVSVTASHNPPTDNGLKFWQPTGQAFDTAQRDALAERIQSQSFALKPARETGNQTTWPDATTRHATAITTDTPAHDPLRIAVDLGNGAGGVTITALKILGHHVTTLNAQPDGTFPGRPSEPTADNCAALRRYVAATDTDLGIAHDGDADRMLAVTEDGTWIPGDTHLALFAAATLAETEANRIAAPVDTSLAVDDHLDRYGATVTRTPVGDVYVAERASEDDVVFGGEPSGAWIWPTETLCPDGPLAAVKLAILTSTDGPISQLVDQVNTYPIRRANVEATNAARAMTTITDHLTTTYDPDQIDTMDGVRVDRGDAWFLIRPSGTQPLIRLTAEARTPHRADAILAEARSIVDAALTDPA